MGTKAAAPSQTTLLTGFPGFLARRLVVELVERSPKGRLVLLVQPKFTAEARKFVAGLPGGGKRVELLTGDVADMHLGLAREEWAALAGSVTGIVHAASVSWLGVPEQQVRRVNVDGTRNMLELAHDAPNLQRFHFVSTCHVSGDRVGIIAEDELEAGQKFRNIYEETKFQAERLVRKAIDGGLDAVVYRPGIVVGDSKTGEIDRFDGPYLLGILMVTRPLGGALPLPLPGNGTAPLNVVPVDFVARAIATLGADPRAKGRTFHLVDPNPLSSQRVYELIAEKTQRKVPRVKVPVRAADAVMRLPWVEKLFRTERAAVGHVNHLSLYTCRNTLDLLDGTGVRCPPLESYLDALVAYVKGIYKQKGLATASGGEDPLDA